MRATETLTAEDFARHVLRSNPFTQDRVTQAQSNPADVGSIHEKSFKKLTKRIEEVRATQQTAGILLTGMAGVGKSHVLARLFRWAREEGKATVVYLHNILASPERVGRYLLHATVSDLAGYRPVNFAQSELYKLINLAIGSRLNGKSKGMAPNLAVRKRVLEEIGHDIDPDQLVMPVFITFLEQAVGANLAEESAEARAIAAVQWLSGETIDPDLARSIGFRVNDEDGACIEDDVAVQRTLDVMCRLCACADRPFVLCVDQVDNLSSDRVTALASFLQALIDNGSNLVVITSGVKTSMDRLMLDQIIPAAASDRIAQHRLELQPVSMKDARAIVIERLERFSASFAKTKKIAKARGADPLTPLSDSWWKRYSGKLIETRPRDVIRAARNAWDAEQERLSDIGVDEWLKGLAKGAEPPATPTRPFPPLDQRIDDLVRLKVTEARNERRLNPARLPPDADNLASLTLTLLEACIGVPGYTLRRVQRVTAKGRLAPYDVRVTEVSPEGAEVTNGLQFFISDNARSAVNALKRLIDDEPPPTHQLFITDQERRPLRLAAKGQETYDKLVASGHFEHVKLLFDDHAELDALSSVLGAARVGDLEVELEPEVYRALSEDECRSSLHRQKMFTQHPLLRLLLTEEPQQTPVHPNPTDVQAEQIKGYIKGELAIALSMSAREMATIIVARTSNSDVAVPTIWEMVKSVANQMHQAKELFVDAQDDDLFLQFA